MLKAKAGSRSKRGREETLATKCATIPGRMRAHRDIAGAHRELAELVALASGRIIVERRGRTVHHVHEGDVMANLWFLRAAHEFAAAAQSDLPHTEQRGHLEFGAKVLLPMCKQIVQQFISDTGMGGVRMDDGGMLVAADKSKKPCPALSWPLRLNALWYAALELTAQALHGAGPLGAALEKKSTRDPTGDHFERLAGRFRRAFSKGYWCPAHTRICPPDSREQPGHAALPDPEQLLLTMLPASPLPRTKQREILAHLRRSTGPHGVFLSHPDHGLVESTIHLAWLAQGTAGPHESAAEHEQAAAIARTLSTLSGASRGAGIHAYYRDGHAIGRTDPCATAEILGTIARFLNDAPV